MFVSSKHPYKIPSDNTENLGKLCQHLSISNRFGKRRVILFEFIVLDINKITFSIANLFCIKGKVRKLFSE